MAGSDSTYGSDLNKLIIELQYRVGALESDVNSAKSFILDQSTTSTPQGTGVAGKYAKWVSDAQLGVASVLSESGSVVTVTGNILSDANNTRDIGSPGNFFKNLYSVNIAASAIAVDILGDATAGFIELQDIPFQPATSGGGSLGITGKEFGDIWGLNVHLDTLDVATAGFIQQKATIQPDMDLSWDLGTNTLRYDGVFSQAFALDTATFLTFGTLVTPEGMVTAGPGAMYASTTGGASATFFVKETGTGNTGWVAYGAAGAGGANTSLSNLSSSGGLSTVAVSQDLIPQGTGVAAGKTLGSPAHHWNDAYLVRLINTGTGNIDVFSNLRPDSGPSVWDLGDATKNWSNLWLSKDPSRIWFKQTGLTPSITMGSVAPNGHLTADVGSLYCNDTGAAGLILWIKETGSGTSSGWTPVNPAGSSPPGSDHYVIYNDAGGFGADLNFQWDKTSHALSTQGSGAIITTTGQFQAANGTAGAPGYAFFHPTDGSGMGLFWHAVNEMSIATSGTEQWRIDSNGNLKATPDNDHDIGSNGILRPRTIYLAKSVKVDSAGTTINEGVRTPIISNDNIGPVRFFDTLEPDSNNFRNCGSDGVAWANVYATAHRFNANLGWTSGSGAPTTPPGTLGGSIYSRTTTTPTLYVYNGSTWVDVLAGGVTVPGASTDVIFNTSGALDAVPDFTFAKATNTLTVNSTGPGNGVIGTTGVNSQIISRGIITTADGSAAAPGYAFNTGLAMGWFKSAANQIDSVTSGVARWRLDSAGNYKPVADNVYDLGTAAPFRPRNVWAGTGIHTPRIDNNGASSVVFGDSLQGPSNDAVNCGSAPAQNGRWASVYSAAFRFDVSVGMFTFAGNPNFNVAAFPGSICLDSSGGQLWIKSSGTGSSGWTVFGAGTGANQALSNLTATAVSQSLIPGGAHDLGSGPPFGTAWANLWTSQVNTGFLGSYTGGVSVNMTDDLYANGHAFVMTSGTSPGGPSIKFNGTSTGISGNAGTLSIGRGGVEMIRIDGSGTWLFINGALRLLGTGGGNVVTY